MNPKKPKEEKARNSGISLEPELIRKGKLLAKKQGLGSISTLARKLLTSVIQEAEAAGENLEESGQKNLSKAKKAVKYTGRQTKGKKEK